MIWLTWRQLRLQAAVTGGGAAILAVLLAVTGPGLARLSRTAGSHFLSEIGGADRTLYLVATLALLAIPALTGLFWGAPVITRELEAGTFRLAWTQTTPGRWIVTKLVVTGLTAVAVSGLLSLALTWWAGPIDTAVNADAALPSPGLGLMIFPRLSREIFDERGLVPAGYAAFAFVLGVLLGILVRRTLPAMALFLAVFLVSQVTMSVAIRPELAGHQQQVVAITPVNLLSLNMANSLTIQPDEPGAWTFGQETVNAAGQPAKAPASIVRCMLTGDPAASSGACLTRLASLGYRQRVSYLPAGEFWQLQITETAIYLIAALALGGTCVLLVRRRLS
jgi:hypothetical protein